MDDDRGSGPVIATIVAVVIVLAAGSFLLSGTQTSKILSTVGASVGPVPGQPADPRATPRSAAGSPLATDSPPAALRDEARIVYTGSLDLVVEDVPAALLMARARIGALDGYVGASRETNDGASPTALITFRIPADRWERAITALRGVASKVVREETQALEVTSELVDLEARIRNLRASETALVAIATDAPRVQDLLDVQRELSTVRGEIERLDAQRASLEDRTAYGTLETTFGVEVVAVQQAAKGWDAASEVDEASARLVARLQRIASALIWFGIAWLPFVLPVVLVTTGGLVLARRRGFFRPRRPIEAWPPAD